MIIIEEAKNNQVFLDSILQLQYYIGTVSGRGDKGVIEDYIKNQGRESDIKQLKLFDMRSLVLLAQVVHNYFPPTLKRCLF